MRKVARTPSAAKRSCERKAATTPALEFVVAAAAPAGNVLVPLARLLLHLAVKEGHQGSRVGKPTQAAEPSPAGVASVPHEPKENGQHGDAGRSRRSCQHPQTKRKGI